MLVPDIVVGMSTGAPTTTREQFRAPVHSGRHRDGMHTALDVRTMGKSSTTRPAPSLSTARAALVDARRYRAEWLVAVAQGLTGPLDLVVQAATEEGEPLRTISLQQLLLSVPGWGHLRSAQVLRDLAGVLDVDCAVVGRHTVGWLLDPRAGGRRVLAWLDAHQRPRAPWPGFPFASARGWAR